SKWVACALQETAGGVRRGSQQVFGGLAVFPTAETNRRFPHVLPVSQAAHVNKSLQRGFNLTVAARREIPYMRQKQVLSVKYVATQFTQVAAAHTLPVQAIG